jgi:hypothetical protein
MTYSCVLMGIELNRSLLSSTGQGFDETVDTGQCVYKEFFCVYKEFYVTQTRYTVPDSRIENSFRPRSGTDQGFLCWLTRFEESNLMVFVNLQIETERVRSFFAISVWKRNT